MAERPAHVLVVERRPLVVDIERDRPPIHVAVRLVLAGMGDDLGVLVEHRRESGGLHTGAGIELVGDQRLRRLLLAGDGILNSIATVLASLASAFATACCTSTPQRTLGPRSRSALRV